MSLLFSFEFYLVGFCREKKKEVMWFLKFVLGGENFMGNVLNSIRGLVFLSRVNKY